MGTRSCDNYTVGGIGIYGSVDISRGVVDAIGGVNNNGFVGTLNANGGQFFGTGGEFFSQGGVGIIGDVTVCGDADVTGMGRIGIKIPNGCSLIVYDIYSGVNATGHNGGAGISITGSMVIHGGYVTGSSYGDDSASGAGIGGDADCDSGEITIYGGAVSGYCGSGGGAGIGGGARGSGGTINIYGGDVYAYGGSSGGAGIGGGARGFGGSINISSSANVHAYGGPGAQDIGDGAQ